MDSVLEEEIIKTDDPSKEEDGTKSEVNPKNVIKDKRFRSLIKMSLNDQIIRNVLKDDTTLGIRKALEKDYQTKSLPNMIYLKQRFPSYKMDEHKTIEQNLDAFLNIIILDEDQAIQILTGLPPKFQPLVHTLKFGSGKDTLMVNEVITSAYAKETELREKVLLHKHKVKQRAYMLATKEGHIIDSQGTYRKAEVKASKIQATTRRRKAVSYVARKVTGRESDLKKERTRFLGQLTFI